jgi:hypothetical protein
MLFTRIFLRFNNRTRICSQPYNRTSARQLLHWLKTASCYGHLARNSRGAVTAPCLSFPSHESMPSLTSIVDVGFAEFMPQSTGNSPYRNT